MRLSFAAKYLMLFSLFNREVRDANDGETISISNSNWLGVDEWYAKGSGIAVNETAAMGIPAIWAAVTTISNSIAQIPLHLYETSDTGETVKATKNGLYTILHDSVNDVTTSYQWRKWLVSRLLLEGRAITAIMRDRSGRVAGFLPLPLTDIKITETVRGGKVARTYRHGSTTYLHSEVLDFILQPMTDGTTHYNPITSNRESIGLIIGAERFAATWFANGGVPPLQLRTTTTGSPAAMERAADDFASFLNLGRERRRTVVPVPAGFELSSIGTDPDKAQMLELRKFQICEVARIFNISPSMLQDLTTGTYSNTEQQALSYVQNTIAPLVKMIEQELNLKLFGVRNKKNWAEHNLDGLKRGDFKNRMDGLARAVNSGLISPNEGRALDNRPSMEGGDQLFIQGATVPLTMAGQVNVKPAAPDAEPPFEPSA